MEKINWRLIIINGLLLWLVVFLVNAILGVGYSFFVGFQTRGDEAALAAAADTIGSSVLFQAITWLAYALSAYWRGGVVAQGVERQEDVAINALGTGLVALVIPIIFEILSPANTIFYLFISAIIILATIWWRATNASKEG